MSGEVFYGQTDGRTADKKRRKNFILGSPVKTGFFDATGNSLVDLKMKNWLLKHAALITRNII